MAFDRKASVNRLSLTVMYKNYVIFGKILMIRLDKMFCFLFSLLPQNRKVVVSSLLPSLRSLFLCSHAYMCLRVSLACASGLSTSHCV